MAAASSSAASSFQEIASAAAADAISWKELAVEHSIIQRADDALTQNEFLELLEKLPGVSADAGKNPPHQDGTGLPDIPQDFELRLKKDVALGHLSAQQLETLTYMILRLTNYGTGA